MERVIAYKECYVVGTHIISHDMQINNSENNVPSQRHKCWIDRFENLWGPIVLDLFTNIDGI